MSGAADLLMRQFLAWVAERPRSYAEAMEAWRSNCPRLSVWEDALDGGLVCLDGQAIGPGTGDMRVVLTPRGRDRLGAA
ncbi:MAG: hypothetical protein IRY87_20400 [Acetobacteraceae bacterium]|nr:hypothetical protein [Acetobacteraceae bacterium]